MLGWETLEMFLPPNQVDHFMFGPNFSQTSSMLMVRIFLILLLGVRELVR